MVTPVSQMKRLSPRELVLHPHEVLTRSQQYVVSSELWPRVHWL